jgi:PAS domain S-box-containing protein
MDYALKELLDIPTLQALLDSLDEINRLPSAVLDTEGNILTATAWQEICTKFHRLNQSTAQMCTKSDTRIKVNVGESASPVIYRCPMGLIDSATPIIVEGEHIGNVFIGQLFMEAPDEAYFSGLARQYSFNEEPYLEAVRKVPLCSEEQLRKNLTFIGNLVQILAEQGLQCKRQIESERELRESEKRLKVIFDTSEAGIIVVSPSGVITFANRRMADMFGAKLMELVGTHYIDYLHESEKHAGVECMRQINDGEVKSVELIRHYIRKDGSDFWGNLTGTRFENIDGSMRDQIIVISDITERKRAEEEKKLLERQLQQAQKLESLGVLAGGIAHDFNNIMTIIMGGCYFIKTNKASADVHIPTIEKAAERAAELCRQMLAYAGISPTSHSQVNMRELVNDMVDLLKTSLPSNTTINYDCGVGVPFTIGDASQLGQVVMNMVINASEAIGNVPGEICISLSTIDICAEQPEKDNLGVTIPPGAYVCLEVADNGSGMNDETMHRIFEPFYTTKFTGRGLGMSAMLGIIKVHKGALQLFSNPGQGTTFKVFLPALPSQSVRYKLSPSDAQTYWQGSGTVLLAEDDEHILLTSKNMLQRLGFTVLEAVNGKIALDVYRKYIDDVVLVVTDIGMPVMDGYQLFKELKKITPNLPIVIASGFGNTVVEAQIPKKDVAGFINKPYSFKRVRDVLKDVMDKKEEPQP